MRAIMILLSCACLAVACGAPAGDEVVVTTESGEAPTAQVSRSGSSPEAVALAELNETCEENWCAGEFDYEFLSLECGETTCELFFLAERGDEEFEDSVVFEYDQPLVEDGYLEAGNWERITDALVDEWELAQEGS